MATQTSPTTGQRYGVSRVCQIWALARSSFVLRRPPAESRGHAPTAATEAGTEAGDYG